jgi:hypothetical protein
MIRRLCRDNLKRVDLLLIDLGEGLDHHLAACGLPFVILFKKHGTNRTQGRSFVLVDSDDIGAASV